MQLRGVAVHFVAGSVAMALVGTPRVLAGADWHDELTRQIAHDENCEVTFMSQVVERMVNGRRLIMAKVHCEDKRSFDVHRGSDDQAFQFKACEVPNAETC